VLNIKERFLGSGYLNRHDDYDRFRVFLFVEKRMCLVQPFGHLKIAGMVKPNSWLRIFI
jgi:hypothetical protein